MEGLVARAHEEFKEKINLSPNNLHEHTLHCTRIHLFADRHVDAKPSEPIRCPINAPPDGCHDRTVEWANPEPEADLSDENRPKLTAVLRLVVLARDDSDRHGIGVHGGTFERLFELFHIDPYIKYLVARNVDGYYSSLPPQRDRSRDVDPDGRAALSQALSLRQLKKESLGVPNTKEDSTRSFYVSVRDSYMVLWSCEPHGGPGGATALSVIAICASDEVSSVEKEVGVLATLIGHPAFPVLACCSRIVHGIDRHVDSALCTIKEVEMQTGLSPNAHPGRRQVGKGHESRSAPHEKGKQNREGGDNSPSRKDDLSEARRSTTWLGEMSAWMSEASVQLAQHSHHLSLVRDVVEKIRKPTFQHMSNADVGDVASLLVETATMTVDYLDLLTKRVAVQQQVLSNLIARDEAAMTFQVAIDSERTAESTANDGFAMMTIALMTLLFLPATFFATIFTMPILGMDSENSDGVMMPQMYLYVKLAVSVTGLAILAWFVVIYFHRRAAADRKEKCKRQKEMLCWQGSANNGTPSLKGQGGLPGATSLNKGSEKSPHSKEGEAATSVDEEGQSSQTRPRKRFRGLLSM